MFDLRGRTAIVTGAGRGIGYAIATAFVEHGAQVALLDRDAAVVPAAERLGDRVQGVVADVAIAAEVDTAVNHVLHQWGRIDILVNNAAVLSSAPFLDLTPAEWERTLAVNLTAIYHTCRAVVPAMIATGYGRLITIASVPASVAVGFSAVLPTAPPKREPLVLPKRWPVSWHHMGSRRTQFVPARSRPRCCR